MAVSTKQPDEEAPPVEEVAATETPAPFKASFRVWVIFLSLVLPSLLSAFEATAVPIALPTIAKELDLGHLTVWVSNCFFLTSAACQPFFSQAADVFGRRWPTILSVALFTLGSGIAGGAQNTAMLLAGRSLQGIGGGGINMLADLIVCDLIPLSDRGTYMGILFACFAIGLAFGPFIGGAIVSTTTWRWVFYLQLPIGGISLVLLVVFLKLNHVRASPMAKLKSLDYLGNLILVMAVVALLLALSWGGTLYAWSDGRVLAPLIAGLGGLGLFVAYEASPQCPNPTTPMILFKARSSSAAFAQTFLHAMLQYWWVFMLPVYFQGVLLSSPEKSGVQYLPTVIAQIPGALLGGYLMSKFGNSRVLHVASSCMVAVALGCTALLDQYSSAAAWALLQIVFAVGSGALLATLLTTCQAAMPDSATAAAAGAWAFFRSLGGICGFAIPSAVFNSRFDQLAAGLSDAAVREAVGNGQAFAHASRDFVLSLPETVQAEVVDAYAQSMRLVWLVSIAFGGALFVCACLEEDVALRTEMETQYGLTGRKEEEASS